MSKKQQKNKKKSDNIQDMKDSIEEIVDDIYDGSDSSDSLIQPKRKTSGFALWAIFVGLIAFLGGVIGELSINNYLYYSGYDVARIWEPVKDEAGADQQIIVFKKEEIGDSENSQTKILIEAASQAVVGIYLKRGGTALVDQLYQPRDKVGNALVLTSDGWLASTATGMPQESGKELIVITADHQLLPIEKIVYDSAAQVVFIKVTADNLKVVKFAEESGVYPGLEAMLIGQTLEGELAQSFISAIDQVRYRKINGFADHFQSTEKYGTFITIKDEVDKNFAGSPLVDMEGGIIGLYLGDGTVIPSYHFADTFSSFLRYESIERPFVGINYIDLAHTIGLPKNISEGLEAGALVFGDREHKIVAVDPKSPAAQANIQFGDIITKVNDDEVDARYSLTEILQQYRVGDVVKLTVQNNGMVREVEMAITKNVGE